jgi:hypothetical protein
MLGWYFEIYCCGRKEKRNFDIAALEKYVGMK